MIIDTGAERSVLMPVDARRMGLDRRRLQHRSNTLGIGGNAEGHDEFALIVIGDDDRGVVFGFRVNLFVPADTEDMREIDGSVLGRDVLDRVRLTYDRRSGLLAFEVLDSDVAIPIRPGQFLEDAPGGRLP